MKICLKSVLICGLIVFSCWSLTVLKDRKQLDDGLIRFHVIANSDSEEDQKIKEAVKEAVLEYIQNDLKRISSIQDAKCYLNESILKIQHLADQTLHQLGFDGNVLATLCKESFDIRHYDTFSLPSGVYDALKITIGDGKGKNWWCVSFPMLCIPATTEAFADTAVSAGFSESLVQTLSGNQSYKIRFFFLDQLGKLENVFSLK